ncbi:MAG: TatD family hydrolase [Magnetococcales bacterium]|nr:TatD family hydrolase [Magnetococcales bacterium]
MIDTHCHLDLTAFDSDRPAVLARSRQAGVNRWVVPGIEIEGFEGILSLTRSNPAIHPALGLHPLYLPTNPPAALDHLAGLLDHHRWDPSPIIAIGEIGLDYTAPQESHGAQQALFDAQLQLAQDRKLPVLLHVRKAHDQVIGLLKKRPLARGGIVHAFNGSITQARRYIDLGFALGCGGVVTRERALKIRRVAASLPETSLVLESDAPDMAPQGYQDTRNEPCHLPLIAQALAHLHKVPVERIMAVTETNTRRVLAIGE